MNVETALYINVTILIIMIIVRSIYGKYPLNPQKMLHKVSQLILVEFSALYNILKVYQSRTPGKGFFQDGVQDGR